MTPSLFHLQTLLQLQTRVCFFHSKPKTGLNLLKCWVSAHEIFSMPVNCLQLKKFRTGLSFFPLEPPKFAASAASAVVSPNIAPSWLELSFLWLGQGPLQLLCCTLKLKSTGMFTERGGLPLSSHPLPLNSSLSRSDETGCVSSKTDFAYTTLHSSVSPEWPGAAADHTTLMTFYQLSF